jgi:hypothetical protein
MEPEKLIDGISTELDSAFKAMAKAKTVEEKVQYSQIIKNLCQSMGVFINAANDMLPFDFEEDE